MSRFSGKCDFYDTIMIWGIDHILNSDVYLGDSPVPLELHTIADCVPYYAHIVSVAGHDNVNHCSYIRLTKKSWVDLEAERYGELRIHEYYKKALQEELEKSKFSGYSA